MNHPGAAATWEMKGVPAAGKYTLHVRYTVPGKDADAALTVNGKPESRSLRLKNFRHAKEGDWENGWTNSYSYLQLEKGPNSVRVSCDSGCEANLDKVWLNQGLGRVRQGYLLLRPAAMPPTCIDWQGGHLRLPAGCGRSGPAVIALRAEQPNSRPLTWSPPCNPRHTTLRWSATGAAS